MKSTCFALIVCQYLAFSAVAGAASLAFGPVQPQLLGLGEERTVTVTITASEDFPGGEVQLSASRESLASVDPADDVAVSVEPAAVMLAAGESAEVTVKIATRTTAPDFTNAAFQLSAVDAADPELNAQAMIPLNVAAIYEIRILGGAGPHQWSSPTTAMFRRHAGGVRVRFVNYDPRAAHIIHGQGAIPHQDTTRPLPPAQNGQPVGEYVVVVAGSTAQSGQYYCHEHEGSNNRRTLSFNAL